MMRLLLATLITLLGLALSGLASVNFNGTWVLDLKASDSPEPMLKRMGVSALERKLAASTRLESTYSQSGNLPDHHYPRARHSRAQNTFVWMVTQRQRQRSERVLTQFELRGHTTVKS